MKMLMLASAFISVSLGYSAHPMMMIALISAQALIICLILWLMMANSWFSFILFLVFMGGLMVLFIYVSSLASNESIMWNNPFTMLNTIIVTGAMITFYAIFFNMETFKESSMTSSMNLIFKIYSSNMMFITSMTMLYLLLTLIIAVKITTLQEGPMRGLK